MKYYPFVKKWAKIKPFLTDKTFNDVLHRDFNKYTMGRWGIEFKRGEFPETHESCSWSWDRKGRHPEYWKYVKHAACHWLVNANLELAKLVEPSKEWQIITSELHSTVWDGNDILFDMNFSALQVDPQEAFDLAYNDGTLMPIGKRMRVYLAENWQTTRNNKTK